MKYIIPLFLLLTAIAHADDIATIRAFRANSTDDVTVQHSVYMACLNLTRTGTEEAVPLLKQLLDDERFSTVARTALINIQGAPPLQRETPKTLTDAEEMSLLKQLIETPDNKDAFRKLQRGVLELQSNQTGRIVLDHLEKFSPERQSALVRNLGARKDSVAVVPTLIDMASGDKPELRLAAIEALGEIGDLRAVDALLHLAGTPAEELADAARESLKRFEGEEFYRKIISLLDSSDKKLVLAALDVIGARRIAAAHDRVWMLLLVDKDVEIRIEAHKAFARFSEPTMNNINRLIYRETDPDTAAEDSDWTESERDALRNTIRDAMMLLCRTTAQREDTAQLFTTFLQPQGVGSGNLRFVPSDDQRLFYLDCLFNVGGEKAAEAIAKIAMGDNDALSDKATELLGQWTTPEVAPFLIEIAEKHPNERYRSRTFRGYLRVIRQFGLPVEQKVQMAEKALAVANAVGLGDADKEQAREVLERFKAMVQGTPIFDGKTFDGWEFRNNEEWFRIEDGAIVGGSMERPIPHNEFLVSKKEYSNFTLRLECKALGEGCNGGIQFRSIRTPADSRSPNEMIGYQADMTDTAQYWGAIYDESRHNRFVAEPKKGLIERIFRPNDWNEYKIACKGNNVKLFLNGVLTVDYTETDENIPLRGFIGLQIHSGPPSETWYRNIRIVEENEKFVSYRQHGAVGDGVTDDFEAIIKAHDVANASGLPVKAELGATYYIGNVKGTAQIQTDTDWGDAKFIIDDSKVTVENRGHHVFNVSSKLPSQKITTVAMLKRNQAKLDLTLPQNSFIEVADNQTMRFIREGLNRNNGAPQIDVFIGDTNGNVDTSTPIIWDFDNISSMTVYPIDVETLTIKGGYFTTIANQAESRSTYYARGIGITRSNVVVDALFHAVTGEGATGAPYSGFVSISKCANVTVQNSTFTGHKTYSTIKAGNAPGTMGTYDINVDKAINVTFKDCRQTNDIHNPIYWGIFGSNYCKNLTFDTVKFSRFDAHMGVANATIKHSVLGHQGINLIGTGLFLVEDTKVCGRSFINLRRDYGSTWEGEIMIRNCEFQPRNGLRADAVLIGGSYSGRHNFGYTCFMPRKITIDGLVIDDRNHGSNYPGPAIFMDFNRANASEEYMEQYPYVITEEVRMENLTIMSGKPIIVSTNPFMFRNVKVTQK